MKTLRLEEVTPSKLHFELNTMQWLEEHRSEQSNEMHKHDYYVIIWVKEGTGTHTVDFQQFELHPQTFWFLSPGQAHAFHFQSPPSGYVISFDSDFFFTYENNRELLIDTGLFHNTFQFKPFTLDTSLTFGLENILQNIQAEYQNRDGIYQEDMLRSLIKMFLIQCARLFSSQLAPTHDESSKSVCLVRRFQDLVELRFSQKNKVADYADQLSVTPSHLNDTVKKVTGQPASEHIKQRVILEIKRKANFGMVSAKEIAFDLGFEDEAHFSKYFKNYTGQTFSEYKKQLASHSKR
ncbi:AraC family transcriptional regulator [Cellulophaga sp. BC115SP]|uniref:helix-turn-helix domain-containing protein n=1 Tax=Cellulophaga sp. BC115SP TaxID=2683263 RepID=UPI001412F9EA|nr:helix-turn-helix domain-containing protein [Cellulophaga sp. BC115SP]NBB28708.1 helix-turn-helix domain-containing protein [Cellulophaga sp. BC115SP]